MGGAQSGSHESGVIVTRFFVLLLNVIVAIINVSSSGPRRQGLVDKTDSQLCAGTQERGVERSCEGRGASQESCGGKQGLPSSAGRWEAGIKGDPEQDGSLK